MSLTTACTVATELNIAQIWRHLLYYANDARGSSDPVKPENLSLSFGAFSASQTESVRSSGQETVRVLEKVSSALRGTLERIEAIDIVCAFQVAPFLRYHCGLDLILSRTLNTYVLFVLCDGYRLAVTQQ